MFLSVLYCCWPNTFLFCNQFLPDSFCVTLVNEQKYFLVLYFEGISTKKAIHSNKDFSSRNLWGSSSMPFGGTLPNRSTHGNKCQDPTMPVSFYHNPCECAVIYLIEPRKGCICPIKLIPMTKMTNRHLKPAYITGITSMINVWC